MVSLVCWLSCALAASASVAPVPRRSRSIKLRDFVLSHAEDGLHAALILWITRDAALSIATDQWKAVRVAPKVADRGLRGRIIRKRARAAQVSAFIGTGYTPRITFLAGLMLRSVQMATRLKYLFDPSLGYAAGTALAASFSAREWLPCMLLGWGAGGAYWGAFRVQPPPPAAAAAPAVP